MDFVPADCIPTTLERVRAFSEPGFVFEEKMDGIRAVVQSRAGGNLVTGCRFGDDGRPAEIVKTHAAYLQSAVLPDVVLDGELMPDGSYWAFDLLAVGKADWRHIDQLHRRSYLERIKGDLPEFVRVLPCYVSLSELGEFGEGVVVKDLQAKYGRGWWKAKRVETDDVLVVSVDYEKQSAEVYGGGRVTGIPATVRAGDCIEVEFFKRFESGKLRNGRFVRVRDDKNASPHPNIDSGFPGVLPRRCTA